MQGENPQQYDSLFGKLAALITPGDRGKSPKNVKVGKVNVESGGQAIVGNVSTDGKTSGTAPDEAPRKPKKRKAA